MANGTRKENDFMITTKTAHHWHAPRQLTTYCHTRLRNGIRISSDVWWLFVHLCGIDAVDSMMMEPEFSRD